MGSPRRQVLEGTSKELSRGGSIGKDCNLPEGQTKFLMQASSTALLGLSKLRTGAQEALVVPESKPTALMSVSPLANNGYTTIFHPYQEGCRNEAGLWTVPLKDEATSSQHLDIDKAAMNVYDLPSTEEVVRFLHAALGFPTKATLLTAAKNGNLVTFPGLTPENINKHFPESDETQKGHMRRSRQGVRSTKVPDDARSQEKGYVLTSSQC
eukprot:scaffold16433_cov32-Cyclotella_meneghiniana.AAC.5